MPGGVRKPVTMFSKIKREWVRRPWWMNLLWLFCLYMTFIYLPFDIFTKPYDQWEEIWFGITLRGWSAKATEPVHWLIYGAGAYGFWKMKSWMWPWAAVYSAQVVVAMVLWNLLNADDLTSGAIRAAIGGTMFLVPTVALWRARPWFRSDGDPAPTLAL